MFVTLNVLLDYVQKYNLEMHLDTSKEWQFERISLLLDNITKKRLYVCALSELLEYNKSKDGGFFICVRDQPFSEKEESLIHTIVVCSDVTKSQLFTELQEIFYQILEWQINMAEAMAGGCGLQEILEMSKPIIGNYIAVNDAAFRMIGNTANIECDDPLSQKMIESGFHPESTFELFRKTNRFEFWEKTDYYIETGHLFSPYTLVGRIFRIKNSYVAHAVMTCNNCDATPRNLDLYEILCGYIAKFAAKDWENRDVKMLIYNSFLIDLIEGNECNMQETEIRNRMSNLLDCKAFSLFRIPAGNVADTLIGKLSKELTEHFSNTQLTYFKQQIIILMGFKKKEYGGSLKRLSSMLENCDLKCGSSSLFKSLEQCKSAYEQSGLALMYGLRRVQQPFSLIYSQSYSHIFLFEDVLQFCLLNNSSDIIQKWRNSGYGQLLGKLVEYDENHGTDNLQLFYNYLSYERRAKETGEIMHMHRNSVAYRVEHIKGIIGDYDLEDPNIRLNILLSYLMMHMYGVD